MVKVAHTGPGIKQFRLLAIVAALIVLAMLWATFAQSRRSRIDKQRAFCAQYQAFYDGTGCVTAPN